MEAKRALVCGAGGFIGSHLVKRLKKEGYWVRGVDLKYPEFSETAADEFLILDLRIPENCKKALTMNYGLKFDEVYQLAADMGGMGFIESAECEIMRNNALINNHMLHEASEQGVGKYFFSSSVCVYRNMKIGESEMSEEGAYPAQPDNEYGWEKIYAERMALAYARNKGMNVRIARFQNCYGPEGTWYGGREKAPAAICRKIAQIEGDEGTIEVWGDGSAVRSYIYIEDLLDGIFKLMNSNLQEPVNIGAPEYISVKELVEIIARIAGKKVNINYINGPVGVESRNFSNKKIESLGWKCNFSLEEGLKKTYFWIKREIEKGEGGQRGAPSISRQYKPL